MWYSVRVNGFAIFAFRLVFVGQFPHYIFTIVGYNFLSGGFQLLVQWSLHIYDHMCPLNHMLFLLGFLLKYYIMQLPQDLCAQFSGIQQSSCRRLTSPSPFLHEEETALGVMHTESSDLEPVFSLLILGYYRNMEVQHDRLCRPLRWLYTYSMHIILNFFIFCKKNQLPISYTLDL